MSIVDVLRPVSTRVTGAATAVPGGTLHGVTSDDNDGTYVEFNDGDYGDNWNLRLASHTPAAGYGRHQIRGRIRILCDAGTCDEDIDLGRGLKDYIRYQTVSVDDTVTEWYTAWYQDPEYGLDVSDALDDLNIGGGWIRSVAGGCTEIRTTECYVDIDCRQQPTYTAQVRDAAGVDRSGGTVTDTNKPALYFGGVSYDGLPPFDWSVEITGSAGSLFVASGAGAPPEQVVLTSGLDNGSYTATFTVRSTIRGVDQFEHVQVITFDVDNTTPPPSPPIVTVTEQFGGYLVEWSDPGGQPWDAGSVVAEVWREDCTGDRRIATVPDGLNGSYLDLAIPQLDPRPTRVSDACETVSDSCDITYRVRYWGYVSELVELPSTLPADLILAWPGSVASIPTGWTRVAALDGYYPRGSSDVVAPVVTGGTATHIHTTPGHTHVIGDHHHWLSGNTGSDGTGTISARFNGATEQQANQPHYHTRPDITWGHYAEHSGSFAPATATADNLPPTRDVVWISSDGARTEYPTGALGWATESVSGWTTDTSSDGRFLRGADAGDPGGVNSGASTHTHTIDTHNHAGFLHTHTVDNTGLSLPVGTNAGYGVSTPRWLPRHTHPITAGIGWTGDLTVVSGGTTGSANHEPPNRRLQVLRNTSGGIQTRIIGLYLGTVAALDPLLTLCDGTDGTPDMRSWFCRDRGSDSVNSTGGSSTHSHTTGTHTHTLPPHHHTTAVGISTTGSFTAPSWGDLGYSPTTGHTHTSGNTYDATPTVSSNSSGSTDTVSHAPPYHEAHFVRLDGSISVTPLAVPELRTSEFAEVTVSAFTYGDGLDRLSDGSRIVAVATDRDYSFPRLVVDSVMIPGGLHTVSTTPSGEDLSLSIGVEGKPAIDGLEDLLTAGMVYFSPVGGTPGWYAPGGWTVGAPAPDVKILQVQMIRQDWPPTDDPADYL